MVDKWRTELEKYQSLLSYLGIQIDDRVFLKVSSWKQLVSNAGNYEKDTKPHSGKIFEDKNL